MNRFLTILTALFLISLNIFSQWEQTSQGLNGGIVWSMTVKDSIIFAGCSNNIDYRPSWIFRSTDNGNSWKSSIAGNSDVNCMAVKDNIIFAGTNYDGLYYSTNDGVNWIKNPLNEDYIGAITVIGNKILVSGNGIFSSIDNGNTWINISSLAHVRILRTDNNKVYAGSGMGGVYSSLDSGRNWTQILTINHPVEGLDFKDNYVYAGSYAGIYRSTNSGANWVFSGIGFTLIPSLIAKNNLLITGTGGFGIYRSTNYGLSYTQSNITQRSAYAFVLEEDNIFAGFSGNGVYISTNDGVTWQQTELHNVSALSLLSSGSDFFAGVAGNGIYYSSNNGLNWAYRGLTYYDVSDFLISDNIIFSATMGDGLHFSSNGGINWVRNSLPANDVFFIDKYENYLFAGTSSVGIFRSSNNGVNWQNIGLNFNDITSFAKHNNILFVFAERNSYPEFKGVKYSSNNGTTWNNSGLLNKKCLSLLSSNNYLFAGTDSSGILRSADNGNTWTQLEINNTDVNCIIDVNNYLICGTGRGVYYSNNSGTNWLYLNNGLDSQRVYSLMISGNYLYAGTEANAVWKLDVSQIIGVNQISTEIPLLYKLHQNYPNPFNPLTKINFEIPKSNSFDENVLLQVYDVSGKLVHTIINQKMVPGTYSVSFDGSSFASGVYFYSINAGNYSESRKMVLVK